jgi:DNA polymerase III subunit epsilon
MTRYIAFDLETTGISSFRDIPVSYGLVEKIVTDRGVEIRREGGLINPGVPIPRGASAIHGITDDMVTDAIAVHEAIDMIAARLHEVWDDGGVVMGMNVSYDLTMVHAVSTRVGAPSWSHERVGGVLDVLVLDRHYDKWRKGPRKLTDLCVHYGVSLDAAHAAVDDAEASLNVLESMMKKYPEIAELEAHAMCEQLGTWHRDWLSSFSQYLERNGKAPIGKGQYDWPIYSGE